MSSPAAAGQARSQQVARPGRYLFGGGHGIVTSQPGEDREQRAQPVIIGLELLLDPVEYPPLAARPVHGVTLPPVPVSAGPTGRAS